METLLPTLYPDVNEILGLLLARVKEILGGRFVGMYLYGSLSSGDFNPETSDIDFLVVTHDLLSEKDIAELEALHKQIRASEMRRASRLEGSYVPKTLIRRHDPDGVACPTVNEGKFYVAKLGSDWIIQRHIVRESGVRLEGPDPKTLIDPVTPDELRGAVSGILQEWWFPMLEDSTWLRKHSSNYHGYAVMTMCRALHALKYGVIVSKPVAVAWTREELGNRWHSLIEQAVASQYGKHAEFLEETLDFIRFTKDRLNVAESAKEDSGNAQDLSSC